MGLKDFNFLEWGLNEEIPKEHSRRIRLVNISTALATFTTLPYVFVFFNCGIVQGVVSLIFLVCFSATWIFNKLGKYKTARMWLYVFSHLYMFMAASILGKEVGEHMILIPILLSAVLVFEFKEKLNLGFIVLLNISVFVLLELTNYSFFKIDFPKYELSYFYYSSLCITLLSSITVASSYFYLYEKQLEENRVMLELSKEIESTINYFSNSFFGKNSIDEILWDVAKNCIGRLGFVDCVIYIVDEKRNVLVQKAAYGEKNPREFEIYQPIDIPIGKGIVGYVAKTGKSVIVNDTSIDPRYISDDQNRSSEIAVPLVYYDKIIGVIDSEHPEKNFFKQRHLSILKTISSLCANKVARALTDEIREKALKLKLEAQKIKDFDRLKSKLFVNVSHELRTPLTLIVGTIDKNIEENSTEDWLVLKQHTNRLLRLINQILDLTKLESGYFKLNNQPGDIIKFMRIMISLFSSMAESRNIIIKHNLPNNELWLLFDKDALEKIFFNILSNAIKFSKENSIIKLDLSYDKQLYISISDGGSGIPENEKEKIFNRFHQAKNNHNIGTGIGLALTKELVDLYNGKIEVSSKVGQGATFAILLPLKESKKITKTKRDNILIDSSEHSPEEHNARDSVGLPLILLVEDNTEISSFIKDQLDFDFEVVHTSDGEKASKFINEQLPDLVISDIMMPNKDGLTLCQEIKENEITSHIPIILLTAKTDIDSKLQGLHKGADDYMTKPFNIRELKIRIKNLLQQRENLRKKFKKIVELKPGDIVISSTEEIFIKKLMTVIEKNMDNSDLSIHQLCEEIGVSRMQLHRKLSSLTGLSATSFIRNQRLIRAGQLLKAGEPVSQVAYAVGFKNLSYFAKVFKEQYDILPSAYPSQHH